MNLQYNIVIGCPRSGTTFLTRCLSALPYSECIWGHLMPLSIIHVINQPLEPEIYGALSRGFEFSLKDYLGSKISDSRAAAVARWLKKCMSTQELQQTFRRQRTIKRVIYKEPFLSFAPEFTYDSLPNCQIIYIYRDGRDAADSQIRSYNVLTDESLTRLNTSEMFIGRKYDHRYIPWWVEEGREAEFIEMPPYVRAIWMWKAMIHRCHRFFSRPDIAASHRVLYLKYEDFVTHPIESGKLIAGHLGCELNSLMVNQLNDARSSSIGIHREHQSASDIELAEKVAGDELALYGYL